MSNCVGAEVVEAASVLDPMPITMSNAVCLMYKHACSMVSLLSSISRAKVAGATSSSRESVKGSPNRVRKTDKILSTAMSKPETSLAKPAELSKKIVAMFDAFWIDSKGNTLPSMPGSKVCAVFVVGSCWPSVALAVSPEFCSPFLNGGGSGSGGEGGSSQAVAKVSRSEPQLDSIRREFADSWNSVESQSHTECP